MALARHGRLVAFETIGAAPAEARYSVFSATKAFVAGAMWLLIGEGQIDVEHRVVDVFPEFAPNDKDVITIKQVMLHTSGFPHAPMSHDRAASRDSRIERMASWRLNWEPGTRYEYHPTSVHWVLAELIERVTGTDYRDFIEQHVTGPLGLPRLLGLDATDQSGITGRVKRREITGDTAKNYRSTLASLCASHGRRPVVQLGRRAVERWLETIAHLQPSSRRGHLSRVTTFMRWLRMEGIIGHGALRDLPTIAAPRTVPRALDPSAAAAVLAHCPDRRARAVWALMLWPGLRCIEVSRLRIEDWDRTGHTLFVSGKGGHLRYAPCPPQVERELNSYLTEHPATVGPFIRSYQFAYRALTAATISIQTSRVMLDAGVKLAAWDGVGAHSGRHTAAADTLDQSGGDVRLVQAMLGHENLASTMVYLRRVDVARMNEVVTQRHYPPAEHDGVTVASLPRP